MPIKHLLLAVAAFAGCTDDPNTVAPISLPHAIVTAVRPSTTQMTQKAALALCGAEQHAPAREELQRKAFGDCVATSIGWVCVPLGVELYQQTLATTLDGRVWTSTPCHLEAAADGFYVADFDSGEVTCVSGLQSIAQPLCM